MKVHTKVVIDMTSGQILEDESYEYEGDVALCGKTKVEAPRPSAAEIALQQEQLRLLRESTEEQKMFKPFLYESMGLRVGADGKLERIPEAELLAKMTPQEKEEYDLYNLYLKRQKDAFEGKLPVSPALEADIEKQRTETEEELSRRLGRDWKLSTPGIQTTGLLDREANLIKEEARRGQISMGEGLIASRMGLLLGKQAQRYGQGQNWVAPAANLSGMYAQAYQPYQFQRQMDYDARMQSAANKAGLISSALGAAGTIGGFALGGYMGRARTK